MKKVMTVAGSDSGGGAGIQADLKTFAAMRVYGTSAITALTAQNTLGVTGIHVVPPDFVAMQMDAVLEDITIDAVKTGMLGSVENVHVLRNRIDKYRIPNLVTDPVMVATSGDSLVEGDQVKLCDAIKELLMPVSRVVTPNIPEAELMTGKSITCIDDMKAACEEIFGWGAASVVVKGGHLDHEDSVDILFDGSFFHEFRDKRIHTTNTHGTGCTFASAVAAGLAGGLEVYEAVETARTFVRRALVNSFPVGHGHGPTHHLGELYRLADAAALANDL